MREAGFFNFLFPQKQTRHVFHVELLYSPTMFHGRYTTAPDDIWTDKRAMLDIKSGDFLEKRPITTSRWKTHRLEQAGY